MKANYTTARSGSRAGYTHLGSLKGRERLASHEGGIRRELLDGVNFAAPVRRSRLPDLEPMEVRLLRAGQFFRSGGWLITTDGIARTTETDLFMRATGATDDVKAASGVSYNIGRWTSTHHVSSDCCDGRGGFFASAPKQI